MHSAFECSDRCFQLAIAGQPQLDEQTVELLRRPQREIKLEIPLQTEDGTLQVFPAYRIQHSDARGPFKGGLRFHPNVTDEASRGSRRS